MTLPSHYYTQAPNAWLADVNAIASLGGASAEDIMYSNAMNNMANHDFALAVGQGIVGIPQGIAKLWGGNEYLDGASDYLEQNKYSSQGFYEPNAFDTMAQMAGLVAPAIATSGAVGGLSGAGWMADAVANAVANAETPENALNFEYTGW